MEDKWVGPRGRRGEMGRETGVDRCSLLVLRMKQVSVRTHCMAERAPLGSVATTGMYVSKQQILPHSRN